ncbi:PEP/pyruvate-binding domain-containing protein [Candidatus Latescibacterota bacterium]
MYCTHVTPEAESSAVGHKAANLGRAMGFGENVPPAFAVTISALGVFLDEAGLARAAFAVFEEEDPATLTQMSEDLSRKILESPLPADLEEEIRRFTDEQLARSPYGLAVRSSGVHEDSEAASFAGVFESFLCCSSAEMVIEAVRRCWISSIKPSALAYARRAGVGVHPNGMAVMVQNVVHADSSGVLLSANPLTGSPWEFVLNCAFGLGDHLVAGQAPADEFYAEWDTGRVLRRQVAEKASTRVPGAAGVQDAVIAGSRRRTASVTDDEVRRLCNLGLRLDRELGQRVDIEWVIDGRDVHLIQVRPLTALPEFFPHEDVEVDGETTWSLDDESPVDPLTRDIAHADQWARYREEELGTVSWRELQVNGYQFEADYVYEPPSLGLPELEKWLSNNEPRLRQAWLVAREEMKGSWLWAREAIEEGSSAADVAPSLLKIRERQADLQAMIYGPPQFMFGPCHRLLDRLLGELKLDTDTAPLFQGLPTFSYERTRAAQDLGRSIHEDHVSDVFRNTELSEIVPCLVEQHPNADFLRSYEDFCHRFASIPPSWLKRPERWAEAMVLNRSQELLMIRSAMLEVGRDVTEALTESIQVRERAESELRQSIAHADPDLRERMNLVLGWAQFWIPMLDDRRWSHLPYYALLDLAWETGVRLTREGEIDDPEDVWLLLPDDLETACAGRSIRKDYEARRIEYEHCARLSAPQSLGKRAEAAEEEVDEPSDTCQDHTTQPPAPDQTVLEGEGIVPGTVVGISRIVDDMTDPALLGSLSDEHILVCRAGSFSNQTDWLGILMIAKGLVTSDGQPCHHAAQIARECGVVYINLPERGITQIADGERIELDGAEGEVHLLG